jgi:hypothetical protein
VFTGHFAVALAGAGASRSLPLWLLIAASFGGDLTEAGVAFVRVNDPTRVWSHSIPATIAVGFVLAVAWKIRGGAWRDAFILLGVAASHSALDFITATKEFVPGSPPFGLNLYTHPVADGILEATFGLVGWMIWRSALTPRSRASAPAFGMLAAILVAQLVATVSLTFWGSSLATEGLSKFIR